MIKFVIFKTLVKGRKILGVERIDEIEGSLQDCRKYCVAKGYAYFCNDKMITNGKFDIRVI